mmetsp:Transcript_43508/g.115009  ORF Transcript_43508/g.115009 Transcript_43508/m.115009 type:complete len:190 (+) Transcript_43508:1413-1982(+)
MELVCRSLSRGMSAAGGETESGPKTGVDGFEPGLDGGCDAGCDAGLLELPERLGFFAAVGSDASPDGRRELELCERDRAPSSFGMTMGGPEALFCGSRGCSMEGAGSSKSIENMASSSLALEAVRLRMDDDGAAKPSEPALLLPVGAAGAGSMKLLWLFWFGRLVERPAGPKGEGPLISRRTLTSAGCG